jgi:hypothetical protein
MRVLFLLCALGCAAALPLAAGTPAPQEGAPLYLTLDQAIHDATTAAPALQAVTAQEQAARWGAAAASRSRFGRADAVASYSRFQNDQIVRPMGLQLFGPQGFSALPWDRDQAHYGVTYQLPMYQGGRLAASIALSALQANQAALVGLRHPLGLAGERHHAPHHAPVTRSSGRCDTRKPEGAGVHRTAGDADGAAGQAAEPRPAEDPHGP